ncbi:MAG: sigma-54-dependent Fis family transcriptional regulator, partial [Deltaproteobacteria bacterium]|nr:sigma-54-dependent Fis family transcriptional regulator [Deltaproteobacteria bacterium]
ALENARLHQGAARHAEELERAHAMAVRESAERAAEVERLVEALSRAAPGVHEPDEEGGIVGRSAALRRALDVARRVAPSDLPVLIEGESGTGKELVARYLHARGPRATGPFVAVNCGALPETLLESELFGHVRGAFTGAMRDHPGVFRVASGGTLLLDEVGEMPARMQTRLLRVLQEGEVRPVGGGHPVKVDVRVVAATHRDLEREVEEGRFRRDLFYRLVGIRIVLPPLRDRRDDIPLLARRALERIAREPGMRPVGLSRSAVSALVAHDWPGNVRELEQTLRRAVLVADGDELTAADLGLGAAGATRRDALSKVDKALLEQALRGARGNRTVAARALGISRVTLHRWMKRHGVA